MQNLLRHRLNLSRTSQTSSNSTLILDSRALKSYGWTRRKKNTIILLKLFDCLQRSLYITEFKLTTHRHICISSGACIVGGCHLESAKRSDCAHVYMFTSCLCIRVSHTLNLPCKPPFPTQYTLTLRIILVGSY